VRSPKLPGTSARPGDTYRDPADQLVVVDHVAIQNAILLALQPAPRQKWQLREALHIPETVIYRELQALRLRGVVKVVGKRLTDRQWALASYQPPRIPDAQTVIAQPHAAKPPAPTTSWWTSASREGFTAQASKKDDRTETRVAPGATLRSTGSTASGLEAK